MKTVAIVGSHPATRGDAPYKQKSIPIWIFNEAGANKWCKRYDAVFQMHVPEIYRSPVNRNGPKHYEWLQKTQATVYMQAVDDTVPNSVKYPLEEIATKYLNGHKFFLSSIDYAIALALYQGYERIKVYGIEMQSNTEYHYQRQGVRVWMSIAHTLGVRVDICSDINVYDRPCYGYEGIITQKPADIHRKVRELANQVDEQREKMMTAERKLGKSYYTNSNIPKKLGDLLDTTKIFGALEGELAEYQKYAHKVDIMELDTGFAYLDRNELEMAAGHAVPKIEEHTGMIHRTAGRLDVALYAWDKTENPAAMSNIKAHAKEHIDAAFKTGYASGTYKANHDLASALDKAIAATGGKDAVDMLVNQPTE